MPERLLSSNFQTPVHFEQPDRLDQRLQREDEPPLSFGAIHAPIAAGEGLLVVLFGRLTRALDPA